MPCVSNRPPAYRRRVIRGREIAYVTVRDNETGERRDDWLGPHGSEESRAAYVKLLAAWEGRGRRLPSADRRAGWSKAQPLPNAATRTGGISAEHSRRSRKA